MLTPIPTPSHWPTQGLLHALTNAAKSSLAATTNTDDKAVYDTLLGLSRSVLRDSSLQAECGLLAGDAMALLTLLRCHGNAPVAARQLPELLEVCIRGLGVRVFCVCAGGERNGVTDSAALPWRRTRDCPAVGGAARGARALYLTLVVFFWWSVCALPGDAMALLTLLRCHGNAPATARQLAGLLEVCVLFLSFWASPLGFWGLCVLCRGCGGNHLLWGFGSKCARLLGHFQQHFSLLCLLLWPMIQERKRALTGFCSILSFSYRYRRIRLRRSLSPAASSVWTATPLFCCAPMQPHPRQNG